MVLEFLEKIPTKILPFALLACTLACTAIVIAVGMLYLAGFKLLLLLLAPLYFLSRFAFQCINNEMGRRNYKEAAIYRAIKYSVDQRYQTKKGK